MELFLQPLLCVFNFCFQHKVLLNIWIHTNCQLKSGQCLSLAGLLVRPLEGCNEVAPDS